MLKVKDAFRRIGPGNNNSQSKRKDTPAPTIKSTPKTISNGNQGNQDTVNGKHITPVKIIEEDEEDNKITDTCRRGSIKQSQSSPQIQRTPSVDIDPSKNQSDLSIVTNQKKLRDDSMEQAKTKVSRKSSSGQRTRSAEDLTALMIASRNPTTTDTEKSTEKVDKPLERNNRSNSHRINRSKSPRISRNNNFNNSKRKAMAHSFEPNKLLEKAIEEGYSDLVESLIVSGQVNINKLNGHGFAPLHLAAFEGKNDIVTILIDNGAYLDILTSNGISALQVAVVEGNFDSAQLLINNGADQGFVLEGPLNPRCSQEWTTALGS